MGRFCLNAHMIADALRGNVREEYYHFEGGAAITHAELYEPDIYRIKQDCDIVLKLTEVEEKASFPRASGSSAAGASSATRPPTAKAATPTATATSSWWKGLPPRASPTWSAA